MTVRNGRKGGIMKRDGDLQDVDLSGWDKDTLGVYLKIAAYHGLAINAQILIEAGADVNIKCGDEGFTPLVAAIGMGHTKIVETLIEAGADVDVKDPNGDPLILYATYTGKLEIVQALIKAGVDIDEESEDGWRALKSAAVRGHTKIMEALIEAGARELEKL